MGRIAVWRLEPPPEQPGLFWRRQPTEAALAARHLYDTLHQLDALGVDAILVEQPPVEPAWRAVQDRLQPVGITVTTITIEDIERRRAEIKKIIQTPEFQERMQEDALLEREIE